MDDVTITVETDPLADDITALGNELTAHAIPTTGVAGFNTLAVLARDAGGSLVGGISAYVNWTWLDVQLFWISEERRGHNLGSSLLRTLESTAVEQGCTHAHLDTFSYQARPFYERHGYTLFATLEDYPPGHQRHFMRKTLLRPSSD